MHHRSYTAGPDLRPTGITHIGAYGESTAVHIMPPGEYSGVMSSSTARGHQRAISESLFYNPVGGALEEVLSSHPQIGKHIMRAVVRNARTIIDRVK